MAATETLEMGLIHAVPFLAVTADGKGATSVTRINRHDHYYTSHRRYQRPN
jgi:hypothetical protein